MLHIDDAGSLALPDDDLVLPFRTVKSDVVGRVIRLGRVVDTILTRHAYPEPVSHALGQALALTAMLGTALKSQAKLILQTKTDGALDFLVADYVAPGKLRGYASFDKTDARLGRNQGPRRPGCPARQGPRRHDHRSRRRQEPLPGRGAARKRAAGGRRPYLLSPIRAAADLHPAGRRPALRAAWRRGAPAPGAGAPAGS